MGQARQIGLHMWLLASRRRSDAVACVPTIESSLTPAGAAAVDRARAPRLPSPLVVPMVMLTLH
jgi:hypothetical protein